jgi:CRP-like cAMP-binding protein
LEETCVLQIDRARFEELLRANPRVSQNLMRILSARLRAANARIQALSRLDVKQRVARQLLIFADKYGAPDAHGSILIQIRLTQADIADLVGATRERVNQVLGEMRRARLLEMDSTNHFTLYAREQLEALVAA